MAAPFLVAVKSWGARPSFSCAEGASPKVLGGSPPCQAVAHSLAAAPCQAVAHSRAAALKSLQKSAKKQWLKLKTEEGREKRP
jgi:hypothetical protein